LPQTYWSSPPSAAAAVTTEWRPLLWHQSDDPCCLGSVVAVKDFSCCFSFELYGSKDLMGL
jgi:hypothetical protein